MKKTIFGTYSLFPPVILWGILLGGIVYSHIAFMPVYLSGLPDSTVLVTGKYAVNEAPFWMTIHPLLVLSLAIALCFNWRSRPRRKLISFSLAIYLSVIAATAVYFVPELLAFAESAGSEVPAAEWQARGALWQNLSLIRGAVCFLGFVPLLIALSRSADEPIKSDTLS